MNTQVNNVCKLQYSTCPTCKAKHRQYFDIQIAGAGFMYKADKLQLTASHYKELH